MTRADAHVYRDAWLDELMRKTKAARHSQLAPYRAQLSEKECKEFDAEVRRLEKVKESKYPPPRYSPLMRTNP